MSILPDGKVLALGGTGDKIFSETSAEIYDPATGAWTETASTTTGRRLAVPLLINKGVLAGKMMVAGGDLGDWGGHTITKKVELYDPVMGTWSSTGNMVSYRYSGGLT